MLFNSFTYVFFLGIVLLLYWTSPKRFRVPLLLIASYVFYMSWSPPFGLIYGPVIFLDSLYFYALSRAMMRWPQHKKSILIFGVTTELALLAYFKYASFLAGSVAQLLGWLHLPGFNAEFHIFLPLAISFTNFILISYLVDVYRGDEKPDPSFVRFTTYVAFSPHLIAGPIVRAKELLHQFDNAPAFCSDRLAKGIHTFLAGLALKLFVADMVAPYVNLVYGEPAMQAFNTSWIATYGFAVQIFADFAGYTLMAQGSALMLGYTLPPNFNAPYFAQNITEFWRRWHMSLSRWLRDYLYIPLGGSRHGRLQTYRNLFITMGLGGLWHGASWHFMIWGLYHGLLLSLHKFCNHFRIIRLLNRPLSILLTFHLVCIGWVFFRATSLQSALHLLQTMLIPKAFAPLSTQALETLATIGVFFMVHGAVRYFSGRIHNPWAVCGIQGLSYACLVYFALVLRTMPQEFIYFQF